MKVLFTFDSPEFKDIKQLTTGTWTKPFTMELLKIRSVTSLRQTPLPSLLPSDIRAPILYLHETRPQTVFPYGCGMTDSEGKKKKSVNPSDTLFPWATAGKHRQLEVWISNTSSRGEQYWLEATSFVTINKTNKPHKVFLAYYPLYTLRKEPF